jgi:hypothetical protein
MRGIHVSDGVVVAVRAADEYYLADEGARRWSWARLCRQRQPRVVIRRAGGGGATQHEWRHTDVWCSRHPSGIGATCGCSWCIWNPAAVDVERSSERCCQQGVGSLSMGTARRARKADGNRLTREIRGNRDPQEGRRRNPCLGMVAVRRRERWVGTQEDSSRQSNSAQNGWEIRATPAARVGPELAWVRSRVCSRGARERGALIVYGRQRGAPGVPVDRRASKAVRRTRERGALMFADASAGSSGLRCRRPWSKWRHTRVSDACESAAGRGSP